MFTRRWRSGWAVTGLVMVLVCIVGTVTAADVPRAQDPVKRLFEAGWEVSFDQQRGVDGIFSKLPATTQAEPRTAYAYALVLMKQRRYTEATKAIERLVERDGQFLPGRRAELWLAMLTKRYSEALTDMAQLGETLVEQSKNPAQAEACRTAADELGATLAFLEGPAATAIAPAQRTALRDKLLTQLVPPLNESFEAGRQRVAGLYADFVAQQDDAGKKAKQEASAKRGQMLDDAKAQRESIAQDREQVAERGEKTRETYRYENEKLTAVERPLLQEWATIQAAAVPFQRQLAEVRRDMARLSDFLARDRERDRERDKERDREAWLRREQILRDLRRLEGLEREIAGRLLELQRQATMTQTKLAEVRGQRAAVEAGVGNELRRTEEEFDNLDRRTRAANATEQKARTAKGDMRRVTTLATRAAAFTTYVPFPLEQEKARILAEATSAPQAP